MALSLMPRALSPGRTFAPMVRILASFRASCINGSHDKRPAEIDIYRVMSEQNFIAVAFVAERFNDVHALLVGRCMKKLALKTEAVEIDINAAF